MRADESVGLTIAEHAKRYLEALAECRAKPVTAADITDYGPDVAPRISREAGMEQAQRDEEIALRYDIRDPQPPVAVTDNRCHGCKVPSRRPLTLIGVWSYCEDCVDLRDSKFKPETWA